MADQGDIPLFGSCQCGNIEYEIVGEPIVMYACHCTDCQKQSASAFGLSLWVNREAFRFIEGTPSFFGVVSDSGNDKLCGFCETCGSRIYHCDSHDSETLSVKAGLLNNVASLRPAGHVWAKSALPWVKLDDSHLVFDQEPASYDLLIKQWRIQRSG